MAAPTLALLDQLEAYTVQPVNPDLPNTWTVQRPDPTWPTAATVIEAVCDTRAQARRVAAGLVALQVAAHMLLRPQLDQTDGEWLAGRLASAVRFAQGE